MARKLTGLLLAASLIVSACGVPADNDPGVSDPDAPLLQIRSEGGFVPLEWVLGRGPRYTLLADGRLIYEGPVIEIYPGPLLPNYQVGMISDEDMVAIMDLVDQIGLPRFSNESDDSAADHIADATTEVVTYWDDNGEHRFSVYGLGIDLDNSNDRVTAFTALIDRLDMSASTMASADYSPDQVRVLAGVSMASPDPQFEDIREWPFDDGLDDWTELANEWLCTKLPPESLGQFEDATQVTQWRHPDDMMDAPLYTLLVRPLLPGEPECPES